MKPKHESQAAAAIRLTEALGTPITRGQVRWWIKKGFDLHDIEKLRGQLLNQERARPGIRSQQQKAVPQPKEPDPLADARPIEERMAGLESALLDAPDYETARRIRTQMAGLRDAFRLDCDRGRYVLASEAAADGATAACASKAAWEGIEDELPPQLEGLTAPQMKLKLREYARGKCLELSDIFTK